MSKPAIVLVHGFWGGAAHWAKVIPLLREQGFDNIHAVENPLTSLADDAERTRKMVKQIDGPVVLVGHSYGGKVITEMGDLPNVGALVFIAAFAPDAGESAGAISQANPPEAFANIQPDSDGFLWVAQDKYHQSFCQDLSEEEAYVMAVTQKAPVGGTFGDNVTAPAWKVKPNWYQISSGDRMLNPENQKMMAARMNPRKTITLDASHASLASRPQEVAAFIVEAANAVSA
ncbi:MAG TPA: alpha/beta hydrolase [Neisseria sp.]|jgi:pimeloyl-ACP methyl ester carboxylesterase|nr:alpha/beta hydrolase [Uruburuella suis]MBP8876259.1 alpha/beta hydrolase [Neisseria sp.]HRL34494.1 alpha/beta hydrolase [Neisseria sp.]HRM22480.1 alpha/beta hydrolase [Neisseria sp.]